LRQQLAAAAQQLEQLSGQLSISTAQSSEQLQQLHLELSDLRDANAVLGSQVDDLNKQLETAAAAAEQLPAVRQELADLQQQHQQTSQALLAAEAEVAAEVSAREGSQAEVAALQEAAEFAGQAVTNELAEAEVQCQKQQEQLGSMKSQQEQLLNQLAAAVAARESAVQEVCYDNMHNEIQACCCLQLKTYYLPLQRP